MKEGIPKSKALPLRDLIYERTLVWYDDSGGETLKKRITCWEVTGGFEVWASRIFPIRGESDWELVCRYEKTQRTARSMAIEAAVALVVTQPSWRLEL